MCACCGPRGRRSRRPARLRPRGCLAARDAALLAAVVADLRDLALVTDGRGPGTVMRRAPRPSFGVSCPGLCCWVAGWGRVLTAGAHLDRVVSRNLLLQLEGRAKGRRTELAPSLWVARCWAGQATVGLHLVAPAAAVACCGISTGSPTSARVSRSEDCASLERRVPARSSSPATLQNCFVATAGAKATPAPVGNRCSPCH